MRHGDLGVGASTRRQQSLHGVGGDERPIAGQRDQVVGDRLRQTRREPGERALIIRQRVTDYRMTIRLIALPVAVGVDQHMRHLRADGGQYVLNQGSSPEWRQAFVFAAHTAAPPARENQCRYPGGRH